MFLDGSQLVVECEIERMLPGWVPRRLGKDTLNPPHLPCSFSLPCLCVCVGVLWLSWQQGEAWEVRKNLDS